MFYEDKEWSHYIENIIATDYCSANFLSTYLDVVTTTRTHSIVLEVFDVQREKVIRNAWDVLKTIEKKSDKPFVFIICKN